MTATFRRVGHKGADLIEPGNTTASFDAALLHGVDMIEVDVLPARRDGSGGLILAHDYEDAAKRQPLTLDQGLEHLAAESFRGLEFIVDLKLPGYEQEVIDALAGHGLSTRSLVSTMYRRSLQSMRAREGGVRLGWSVPRARRDYLRSPLLALPALAALRAFRVTLLRSAPASIRSRLCDAILAHWRLVTPPLVRTVTAAGGELYVWTVDEATHIRALGDLGVTGVITNDPRLFGVRA